MGQYHDFLDLIPFTNYDVSIAAETSAGRGPFSAPIANMTFEGCKLTISVYLHMFVSFGIAILYLELLHQKTCNQIRKIMNISSPLTAAT